MFKPSLTKKNGNSLGLDIGSQATKYVILNHREGQKSRLVSYGLMECPSSSADYAERLKDFVAKNKLSGLSTSASINNNSLKIRKIELPRMPDSDLKDAIKWKMRDVVEGSVDEYVVRYSHLNDPGDTKIKKLLYVGYAIKKDTVNHMVKLLDGTGLRATFIEPSIVSLAAAIERVYSSENHWIAGIDIGQNKSIMVVLGKGKFYFSRPLPGINLESMDDKDHINQKLAAEIQNSLDTFAVTFHVEHIHKIFLSGGGAGSGDIAGYLTANLGIETEIFNPFNSIELNVKGEQKIDRPYLYSQAVSLAQMGI